ncbi:MAG TPA: aldehyde dehydrogenase family protein, partial [Candidatus Nanoarchaeia archaeon]|nr:aldehyde dehydrogenase family protein [Candidatus Nanoarchaeia archaeon]
MSKLISTNPAQGYEKVGEVDISTVEEIHDKVKLANKAKLQWKELGVKKRIKLLNQVYEEFEKRKEEFSRLITREMGKPTKESISEVTSALKKFKWFLDHGEKALKDEITFKGKDSIHKIVYEPFGAAAVIAPWNYPLGMLIWGIVPNLIVGNTVVCKTSEECPLTGKLVEEIMDSKSIPRGVFSEVYGAGNVGQKLAESDVNLIWFTGSTKVGKLLYKIAAEKFIKGI